MGIVAEVTDSSFQTDVLDSAEPVLVDFWAPWCAPCRMIAPMVEELAVENQGSIKVTKINVADNTRVAQNYRIDSLPTLMIFKDGKIVEVMKEAQPKSRLQQALDEVKA